MDTSEGRPPTARADDGAEFECVALPWLDAVYRFARSLTHDAADADDLVQDTFLRALRSWHTFRPGSDCRRWLFAICHHAFLSSHKRSHARPGHDDASDGDIDALPAVMLHHGAVRDGTDELLARIDLRPALDDALAHLREPFRAAVVLVDGEDYSYEEAAVVLQVPVGTVRSRLYRGRRLLQEGLFAHARDAGISCAMSPGAVPHAVRSVVPAASPAVPPPVLTEVPHA
jgi:RNA polymerase sigma-70 factor (ECF subfamily)